MGVLTKPETPNLPLVPKLRLTSAPNLSAALLRTKCMAPISAPRPKSVPCGPLTTSTLSRSKSSTTEALLREMETSSWKTEMRGCEYAAPSSDVTPRIT